MAGAGVIAYFVVTRLVLSHSSTAAAGKMTGARPVPVVVAIARRGDMNLYLNGLGTITALNTVTLRGRVDGELTQVLYSEGQMVKKGELLVQIDPRPFQVQLEQAEGQLTRDQAQLQNARLDLRRYQSIAGSITQQQIDTQRATISQFEGAVKSDQGQIDNANLQLAYCKITAPLSGRIGLRMVDQGNIVHANDAGGLAVITQIEPIALVFPIPQDKISQVFNRPDHGEGLTVDAYDRDMTHRLATGKLLAIDNQVDPTTGTVRLKAQFDNRDHALFPNQFVNARLLVNTLQAVVIVPSAAVQRGPDMIFAYVVGNDDAVDLRNVAIGPVEGDQTVIEDGIRPGEIVVIDGVDKLQPGSKVATRQVAPAGGGPATAPTSHKVPSTRPTNPRGASPSRSSVGGDTE